MSSGYASKPVAAGSLTLLSVLGGAALLGAPAAGCALDFRIDEGNNVNSFVREHDVAAHLLLRSGTQPRILIAFPAGDSAVAVWFGGPSTAVHWRLLGPPRATIAADAAGRRLNGIEAEALADVPVMRVDRAVLSSVRVLRTFESQGTVPEAVVVAPTRTHDRLTWARDRLDGAPGYRISIEALDGARIVGGLISRHSGTGLHLKIRAFTGEKPLTPLDGAALFTAEAGNDRRAREVLAFLSYRQKYLAGSWRFDTYFGRDTLMSMPCCVRRCSPSGGERPSPRSRSPLADGEVGTRGGHRRICRASEFARGSGPGCHADLRLRHGG